MYFTGMPFSIYWVTITLFMFLHTDGIITQPGGVHGVNVYGMITAQELLFTTDITM